MSVTLLEGVEGVHFSASETSLSLRGFGLWIFLIPFECLFLRDTTLSPWRHEQAHLVRGLKWENTIYDRGRQFYDLSEKCIACHFYLRNTAHIQ
jgi:hypothetical protein